MKIEAIHDFHDAAYAAEWARRFEISEARSKLFQDMGDLLEQHCSKEMVVLELGTGPGYLAHYLLSRFPKLQYTGLDFSRAMLEIAGTRSVAFQDRVNLIQFDLLEDDYSKVLPQKADAIVSTWALHDLFDPNNIQQVYANCRELLEGILVNGDFVKPAGIEREYEGGRIEIGEHLGMLRSLGYTAVDCPFGYEIDVEQPTTSNNYACMVGFWKTGIA